MNCIYSRELREKQLFPQHKLPAQINSGQFASSKGPCWKEGLMGLEWMTPGWYLPGGLQPD